MSKPKYKKGKLIKTISDFANSKSNWFMINFGLSGFKTRHRSFLISWQYRTLETFINNGKVYEADAIIDSLANARNQEKEV